jgi:hypothetical protein
MSPIILTIQPYCSPTSAKRIRGKSEVRLDGRLICISHQPRLDSARVLAAEGIDPATPIHTRHEGAMFDALRSTIGIAANLTVEESQKIGPRFARWKRVSRSDVGAPKRFSSPSVSEIRRLAEPFNDGVN